MNGLTTMDWTLPPDLHGTNRLSLAVVVSVVLHAALILGIALENHQKNHAQPGKPMRIEFLGTPPTTTRQPREVEALAEINQEAGGQASRDRANTPATSPLPAERPALAETPEPTPPAPTRMVPSPPVPATPPPPPMARPKARSELMVNQEENKRKTREDPTPANKISRDPVALKMSPTLGDVAAWDRKLQEEARQKEKNAEGAVDINTRQVKYAAYFRGIKQRIEQVWSYPNTAKKNRQTGNLLLEFTIDQEGNMVEIELLRSSGVAMLDDAAIKAIRKAGPFPPLPAEWKKPQLRIKVTFEYLMRQLGW